MFFVGFHIVLMLIAFIILFVFKGKNKKLYNNILNKTFLMQ
ncbi:hypothetical protein GAPWK_2533 [Gilliamella apicola]|nr:hypothetical protein GAPWK_2533 [Gilliamella apicola]